MKVIGAGFGRTGTMSLKAALEALDCGPCYHMAEVFKHLDHVPTWEAAARGEPVDWTSLMAGWGASVDWPACTFYAELMAAFPEAKVLLSTRDPARWYESCRETIYRPDTLFPLRLLLNYSPRTRAVMRMGRTIIWQGTFGGRFLDRERAIAAYEAHVEAVLRAVPPDRLLVYEVSQGWEPLCRFLGVPVPERPFPHVNDRAAVRRGLTAMNAVAWAFLLGPVLLVAGLIRLLVG